MELIKNALQGLTVSTESIKTDPAAETAEARALTPAAKAQQALDAAEDNHVGAAGAAEEKKGVVMSGPLGVIFTRALNLAYAKRDPATGEYTAASDTTPQFPQGEVATMEELALAMESQANDWMRAAAALREKEAGLIAQGRDVLEDGSSDDVGKTVPLTTSGTRAVQVTPEEVISIFQRPDDLPGGSGGAHCDFIFYTDATAPNDHSPMGVDSSRGEKMIYMGDGWRTTLESISIVVKTRTDKI